MHWSAIAARKMVVEELQLVIIFFSYIKGKVISMAALSVGTKAPDFTLPSTPDQKVSLSEFRGGNVVLVFYPADWSPVCGDQLALYNELRDQFEKFNASLVAISVDGIWCHLA